MTESQRLALIANAVASSKEVAPQFQGLLEDLKAEEFVLQHGLIEVTEKEIEDEFVSLDSVESDKDDIDEDDEEQTDMDCVSSSFADLFDVIES